MASAEYWDTTALWALSLRDDVQKKEVLSLQGLGLDGLGARLLTKPACIAGVPAP